jgi:hypothetical protein
MKPAFDLNFYLREEGVEMFISINIFPLPTVDSGIFILCKEMQNETL